MQDHRQPQHRPLRRAPADGGLRHPPRNARRDHARVRRGRPARGGRDHRRRARRRRPRRAARAQRRALRAPPALPGLPRLHGVPRTADERRRPSASRSSTTRWCSTSSGSSATPRPRPQFFRQLVNELALLLTYEATKDLAVEEVEIETPLERMTVQRISGKKVAVCRSSAPGSGCSTACSRSLRRRASASSASTATRRRSSPSSTT